MNKHERLSWSDYFMRIAWDVSVRSNCKLRSVGALIVVDQCIVSTGYNGTLSGVKNCYEGGCPRCASDMPRHYDADICLYVHAELNAVLLAARHGTATNGATLYVTLRPCLGCLKELIQAGIRKIVYDQPFGYDGELEKMEEIYQSLVKDIRIVTCQHQYSATHPLPPEVVVPGNYGADSENAINVAHDLGRASYAMYSLF